MGTWDVNPLEHCIYLHLHLNLHPLSHRKTPLSWCVWETQSIPHRLSLGMFFSLLVTGLLGIEFFFLGSCDDQTRTFFHQTKRLLINHHVTPKPTASGVSPSPQAATTWHMHGASPSSVAVTVFPL